MSSEKVSAKPDSEPLKITFRDELSGLFHKYHDRVLVDASLPDKDVVLLAIYLLEEQSGKAGVKYLDCKNLFVSLGRRENPNFKVSVHNAKKESSIRQEDSILYFLSGGLGRISSLLGQIEKAPVYVIKSGQSFTAIKLLEEFLAKEVSSKDILLCDSYVSPSTLFPFLVLKGKVNLINILTSNIQDGEKFKDYLAKMRKETGISIEVKLNNKIHDRYLIAGDKCWTIGSSIKDLGNKDTTVRDISEVTSSIRELFLERWSES
jgi:hypothetical protein